MPRKGDPSFFRCSSWGPALSSHLSKGFASSTPHWLSTSGNPPSSRTRSCAAWHRKHALPTTFSSSALRPAGAPLDTPTAPAAPAASPARPTGTPGVAATATAVAAAVAGTPLPGAAGLVPRLAVGAGSGSAAAPPPHPRRSRRQRGTSLVSGCAAVGEVRDGDGGGGGIDSQAPGAR